MVGPTRGMVGRRNKLVLTRSKFEDKLVQNHGQLMEPTTNEEAQEQVEEELDGLLCMMAPCW